MKKITLEALMFLGALICSVGLVQSFFSIVIDGNIYGFIGLFGSLMAGLGWFLARSEWEKIT
jgi:hypothetical protein